MQNTRKAADFQIDDRIHLRVEGPDEIVEMLDVHGEWVQKETLAVSLDVARTSEGEVMEACEAADPIAPDVVSDAYSEKLKVNGLPVVVEVAKANPSLR